MTRTHQYKVQKLSRNYGIYLQINQITTVYRMDVGD
jgi:hypothetical protein